MNENTEENNDENEFSIFLNEKRTKALKIIHSYISDGAHSFLKAEYEILFVFIAIFSIILFLLLGSVNTCGGKVFHIPKTDINDEIICDPYNPIIGCKWEYIEGKCWSKSAYIMLSFILGGLISILGGFIGLKVAVYSNVRTAVECEKGWCEGFNTAFRSGSIIGFSLSSLGLIGLFLLIWIYSFICGWNDEYYSAEELFEMIEGYSLGGSTIALFGRVGGGIYNKAADIGADLVGKIEKGIPEDDPRNPAVIADNVGDNVGDIAGMGADLFGSFAESSCAALTIASSSPEINCNWKYLLFPLSISASGILVGVITTLFATSISCLKVRKENHIERNLKLQLFISTLLMSPMLGFITYNFLPSKFCVDVLEEVEMINNVPSLCRKYTTEWKCFFCMLAGLWCGLIIGFYTDYMTSYKHKPVKEVAQSCETGAATNIIFGLALGYKSCVVPATALSLTILLSFYLANMYGIAISALGMLSIISIALTTDAYGPITDNSRGIAEMTDLALSVKIKTNALYVAGNVTVALGKGFAIGSAALDSLALLCTFVTKAGIQSINLLNELTFPGLLIGAMLPYWFSALTIKSVGKAAKSMVNEVRRQFHENPRIMFEDKPDYQKCIGISTKASLKEMLHPGALVLLTPIISGYFLGVQTLLGIITGGLISGLQIAISNANSGSAWDNTKVNIEKQEIKQGTYTYSAAVVGDTVGDPLKDASGPSLNIYMKLSTSIALALVPFFLSHSLISK